MIPLYIGSYKSGELDKKIEEAYERLHACDICPRRCGVNRIRGEVGYCKAGINPKVSDYFPHFGEEKVLVGKRGSGTIFFTFCNLGCVFCQNYTISHLGIGEEITVEDLAKIMLYLQKMGCHNINLVTPTHFVPQILSALKIAIEKGLNIPIVYNTSGYENISTLKLLEGVIDIYMPDIKFFDPKVAKKFSNAEDYPEITKMALKEMYRQVGDLKLNEKGIAERGLIIRHLLLPNNLSGLDGWLDFIKEELSTNVFLNIMDQYRPLYKAYQYQEINRTITWKEYKHAIDLALQKSFRNLYDEK
ncbi:MAG: radical SAM protein [Dictyoglomus sp. NZ13-RE01]|nr:MAG: radical SAM protein [Dictyoglomus sp. NZ13-RE01]